MLATGNSNALRRRDQALLRGMHIRTRLNIRQIGRQWLQAVRQAVAIVQCSAGIQTTEEGKGLTRNPELATQLFHRGP